MLFNSYPFVLGFLPFILLAYEALSAAGLRALVPWLMVGASLFFYAWWNWHFLPLFVASIVVNYFFGQALAAGAEKGRSPAPQVSRRALLTAGIVFNVLLLGYFKYRDFFVGSVNDAFGSKLPLLHLALPLAISFFTFEQITYLLSSYRGEEGVRDGLSYLLFISFFPHLIAGPIVRYRQIYPQFNRHSRFGLRADNLSAGLMIFAIGLFKKVLLADSLREYAQPVFAHHGALALSDAWGGALAFALQIYFDFSGYSDMAIGLARMFNVEFPENFDSPYQVTNPIDFWRRWHMTLSYFLRDYVYIPLGGNRCSEPRQYLNIFLTLLIGGLWHGANWTFVAWGAMHGCLVCGNHYWRARGWRMPPGLGWLLTFGAVVVTFVFFRAPTFVGAWAIVRTMAGLGGLHHAAGTRYLIERRHWWRLALMLAVVTLMPNRQALMRWQWRSDYLWAAAFAALAAVSLANMASPPAFIYFQF